MSDREATGGPEEEPISPESDYGSFVPEATEPRADITDYEPPKVEPAKAEPVSLPEPEQHRVFAGTGISWAFILGVILTVAIIVLAVQNTDTVPVTLYFWETTAPLIIVMVVAALAAILIDEMIGLVIRRRKRKVLAELEELKQLRARADGKQPRIE